VIDTMLTQQRIVLAVPM